MSAKKIFGQNLRRYRKTRNLTQEQLAERIDVSHNHLSKIEMGIRFVTAELLDRIAQELDVSLAALMFDETSVRNDGDLFARVETLISTELDSAKDAIRKELHSILRSDTSTAR